MKNQQLIDDHRKLIEYEAGKYSTMVPYIVVLSEAYKLASKAAESYDPAKGVKFSTHLTNQLKKLSRISTKYGTTVRLPENKQFKLKHINDAELELTETLGRAPNVSEISHHTGISVAHINKIKQGHRNEVNLSQLQYSPVFVNNTNDDWLHFVYHDLTDLDKVIFEYKTGFGGKPKLENSEIAKKLNLSPGTVANRARMISEKISQHWDDEA